VTHATPWTASYPPTLRWDSEIPLRPVDQILDDAVARWPDQVAIDFMGRRFSYAELAQLVARAAKGLQALGVGPGVHVGLYLANTPHYMISFFAVLKAGGVVVNYSPLDAEKVLEHKIGDSQTDVLVTLDFQALYPQMDRLLASTRLKTLVVGTLGEMTAHSAAVTQQLRGAGQLSEVAFDARHVAFANLIDNDGAYTRHDIGDPRDALAVLQYTGGTTGLPKGAMLTHANLNVYCTDMGEDGVDLAKLYDYDLILLDLNLPDMSGHDVLRQIRQARVETPILILSGSDDTENKLKGFGFGADDYLTKPFHREELVARIHAIIRRSKGHSQSVIKTGEISVNLDAKTVDVDGKTVHLTGKEYQMLELLSLRKGTTLTKEMFLNHLYGGMDEPELKIIDVFICKLRKKPAEATGGDNYIETVWGRGYVLRDPAGGTARLAASA